MKSKPVLFSLALVLSVAGCRSSGDGDGTNDGPDGGAADDTVYDLQDDAMPVGTPVTLRDVVVTAVDTFGGRTGGIYIMEPEGGPFSGVFVFLQDATAASLQPGDIIDVEGGVKDEFALSADDSGRTLTELSAPQNGSITITKTGSGSVPAPEVLLPQDLAADDAEAEKWEGVLVTFKDVRALNAPQGSTQSDPTLNDFDITGPFNVQSSLVEFPNGILRDDCFTELTGIVDYFFEYKLLPRTAGDIGGTTSTNCLALEDNDGLCGDGKDNDFNGFTDCEDLGCIPATVSCPVSTSNVTSVQDGTITAGTRVSLSGVVVTAMSGNGKNLWIQDAGGAALNNGVFVFHNAALDAQIQVGSIVDIEGTVSEFNTLTELTQATVTFVSNTGTAEVLSATLVEASTEEYEGVLVTVQNVRVSVGTEGGCTSFCDFTVTDGTNTLEVEDDAFFGMTANLDDCVTLTGVMHFNSFDDPNHVSLLPRPDGLTAGSGCP